MCDVCFVILHYKTYDDTVECIDSIMSIQGEKNIVIVDNFSNNGSLEKLDEKYLNTPNIYIIKCDTNLGFAKGNNIGYRYARNILKAKYIAVINNDIIVESFDFIEKITKEAITDKYHVVGPDIVSFYTGTHQNPMGKESVNVGIVIVRIINLCILYFVNKLGMYGLVRSIQEKKQNKNSSENNFNLVSQDNVQLHGSFLIFMPKYVLLENEAFCQDTFLFMEEALLRLKCEKKGYFTYYNSDIKVIHKEDSSTDSLFVKDKEKINFVFKNQINSYFIYLKYLLKK